MAAKHERPVRQVYTPRAEPKEQEPPRTIIRAQIEAEEQEAQLYDPTLVADDETPIPVENLLTLEQKLADLGIDPDELRAFCKTATLVPAGMPADPWDSYELVGETVQAIAQELKQCGAKSYHIRQALEGAISRLEKDEHEERRAYYESGGEEAQEEAGQDQQPRSAGSDDTPREEAQETET